MNTTQNLNDPVAGRAAIGAAEGLVQLSIDKRFPLIAHMTYQRRHEVTKTSMKDWEPFAPCRIDDSPTCCGAAIDVPMGTPSDTARTAEPIRIDQLGPREPRAM